MSRYSKLTHYETHATLESSKHYTTDDNYEMFPDYTLIHCQLINSNGKNIKLDGSFGNQLIGVEFVTRRYSEEIFCTL